MAENRNFISAKDLPVSESEEVDVLVVDDGELKRKPAANLGGGGGEADDEYGGFDVVFKAIYQGGTTEIAVVKGSFETVKEKILEDEPVSAFLLYHFQGGSPWMIYQIPLNHIVCTDYIGDNIDFRFTAVSQYNIEVHTVNLSSDNSVSDNIEYCNFS